MEMKMDWLLLVIGFLVGAAGGAGLTAGVIKNKEPRVIEKTIEVDRSLTSADLLKVPCSSEYIKDHGPSMCREMFCRMNTRSGNQSNAASAKECEAISNTINKQYILDQCYKMAAKLDLQAQELEAREKACLEFFDRRL